MSEISEVAVARRVPSIADERLRDKLFKLLEDPKPYHDAIADFRFTGIETMKQRILEFRGYKS